MTEQGKLCLKLGSSLQTCFLPQDVQIANDIVYFYIEETLAGRLRQSGAKKGDGCRKPLPFGESTNDSTRGVS